MIVPIRVMICSKVIEIDLDAALAAAQGSLMMMVNGSRVSSEEHRMRGAWVAIGGWILLAGCSLGGQSGTEGGDAPHCVCEQSWTLIRGTVTAHESDQWSVRVDEWTGERTGEFGFTSTSQPEPLAVGSTVSGTWKPGHFCGAGVDIEVGQEVLFDVRPRTDAWLDCPDYADCATTSCGPEPERTVLEESDDGATGSTPHDDWLGCATERCGVDLSLVDQCRQEPGVWQQAVLQLAGREGDAWNFGEGKDGPWLVPDDSVASLPDASRCLALLPYEPPCDVYRDGVADCD
jgi:hypothetical protein